VLESSAAVSASATDYDCPSAQPDMQGARPFGVISGTIEETRIAFFKKSALAEFNWRDTFSTTDATRVLRFSARCEKHRCIHFSGTQCSLGHRVKQELPAVVDTLPSCLIRPTCRWYFEQGSDVCLRCPQVVTMIPEGDPQLSVVASVR
jgi:hypothetical protein